MRLATTYHHRSRGSSDFPDSFYCLRRRPTRYDRRHGFTYAMPVQLSGSAVQRIVRTEKQWYGVLGACPSWAPFYCGPRERGPLRGLRFDYTCSTSQPA
jgi:hypothetical protein